MNEGPQADLDRIGDLDSVRKDFLPTVFENVHWVAHLIAPGGTFTYIRKFARTYDIVPYESTIAVVFQPGIYEFKPCDDPRKYFFVHNGARKEVELNDDWETWRREFYEWVAAEHKASPAEL